MKEVLSVKSADIPASEVDLIAELKKKSGIKYYNKKAKIAASISGKSAKKIANAQNESIANLVFLGYSEQEASYIHRAAATKIGELFEQSENYLEENVYHRADEREKPGIFLNR